MTNFAMRRGEPADAEAIVELHGRPHVRDMLIAPSLEQVRHALGSLSVEHFIVLADGQPLGIIMFAELDSWLFEIRIMVAGREGIGIGSFALEWTLAHIFRERAAHRVYLEVHARNERARRLYERHGFAYEGTYRDGTRNPVSGAFEDLCIYGLLAEEYQQARTATSRSRE